VYEHVVPLQLLAVTFVLAQVTPHAPHAVVDDSEDSHPSVSGAVFVQSA
jgi:hypothetical protein